MINHQLLQCVRTKDSETPFQKRLDHLQILLPEILKAFFANGQQRNVTRFCLSTISILISLFAFFVTALLKPPQSPRSEVIVMISILLRFSFNIIPPTPSADADERFFRR